MMYLTYRMTVREWLRGLVADYRGARVWRTDERAERDEEWMETFLTCPP